MTPEELEALGAQIVLGNTFHLAYCGPGRTEDRRPARSRWPARFHGLEPAHPHRFGRLPGVQPPRPCARSSLNRRSLLPLSRWTVPSVHMSPERIPWTCSACPGNPTSRWRFDDCTAYPAHLRSARRVSRCCARCAGRCAGLRTPLLSRNAPPGHLFGIVQGGMHDDTCALESLGRLLSHAPRVGIGPILPIGRAGGRPSPTRPLRMLEAVAPQLPADRPRYLMGVGLSRQHRGGSGARRSICSIA